jgi:histidinol-phosphate aminotransferase
MQIYRRELLRRLGTAAAVSAFWPPLVESASLAGDSSPRLVRLDRNESAYGPCEKATAACREAFADANRFPGKDVENLRAAIAASHGVQPDNITLGCGSTELLRMTAEASLGPGKTLVMASPTFDSIADAARVLGAEVRSTPFTRDYAHDLDAMLARTDTTTGLIYICNPNNPTGTLTPKSDLETFLRKVPSGASVVIDEAYHDYVTPSGAYDSWAARAAAEPQLIVTRTFSKIYGLAGLRVGYAVSSVETAKRLAERRLPMNVNVVAARVALAALSDSRYVEKIAAVNSNDRQEFLNQVNARMLRCLDSHTNFVFLRTEASGKEVAEMLRAQGVLVGAGYPCFEKHIRVSLGLPEEMEAFWRAWDASMPHHPM